MAPNMWYRVMLVFPVEVLSGSKQDALSLAMEAFLEELNESGLDSAHDLLASDDDDVYEVQLGDEFDLSDD